MLLLIACGTLPQKNDYSITRTSVELGVIGKRLKSIHQTEFETSAIPSYKKKIKVKISARPFSKSIFKSYKKAVEGKNTENILKYSDSIKPKPTFYEVSIEDKNEIVNVLNSKESTILKYLKNSPKSTLVSALRLLPNTELKQYVSQADAFYLQTDSRKKPWLIIYKNEKEIAKVNLSKSIIFGYKLSSFCWRITSKRKIEIASIVDEGNVCTLKTRRNPELLEKELLKNSLKF